MPITRFFFPVLVSIGLGASGLAAAQTPAANTAAPAPAAAAADEKRPEPRIERIQVDEGGTRVDELRVRGETKSITVTPKGGMPAYDVTPERAGGGPAATGRDGTPASGGASTWKLFDF
jgi:Protein of unknown function (DUF2782)